MFYLLGYYLSHYTLSKWYRSIWHSFGILQEWSGNCAQEPESRVQVAQHLICTRVRTYMQTHTHVRAHTQTHIGHCEGVYNGSV